MDVFAETLRALVANVQIRYCNRNADGSGIVFLGWNPHRWGERTSENLQHSGKARKEWDALHEALKPLVRRSAPERASRLEKIDKAVRRS